MFQISIQKGIVEPVYLYLLYIFYMFWVLASLANLHMHASLLWTSIVKVIILSYEYFILNSDCITYYGYNAFSPGPTLSLYISTTFLHAALLVSSSQEPLTSMPTTSAAGLALHCHMIPLVSLYNHKAEGSQVSLSCYINLGDGTKEKRKYNIPLMTTQDVETLCCCVLEFEDVLAPPRLSLMTGPLKLSFFRQCLGGTIHDQWDTLTDDLNETVANFTIASNNLIAELVHPTDLADQQHYLETSKKPYHLNCAALAAQHRNH